MLTGSYTDTLHPIVDTIALTLGYKQLQYAVVIDAGSTGSRVIAYEFHIGYLDSRLVLDKELFVQVKPGLSFYHDKPTEVIENVTICLTHAGLFITIFFLLILFLLFVIIKGSGVNQRLTG